MNKSEISATTDLAKRFRLLECSELVRLGDFVADGHGGFELWEGLSGFRADAFVKPIYRQNKSRSPNKDELSLR
jgi:hypothetical protein